MGSGIRRGRRWLMAAAIGVLLSMTVNPIILCENALHINASLRPAPQPELAEAVAHDTGASWMSVEIAAQDGVPLRGWWFTPAHPKAAVILLHGIADSRRGMLGHARFLLQHDFAVLTPDCRGHGVSGGEAISYGLKETSDVHRWADWMCGRGVHNLYGLGESMGAAILLESLRVEPRFQAVVAECSFVSFEEIAYDRMSQFAGLGRTAAWPLVQPALVYARMVRGLDLRQASPAEAIRSARVPILLIHGTADTNIPPRHSRELHALNPSGTTLWEIPGARHVGGLVTQPQAYADRVVAWFNKSL